MKNHFFFPYTGNKREEVEIITKQIESKLDNIETIVEPFCGSAAFSYYISSKYPNKYKYVLNDNDNNLIELLNTVKDTTKFNKLVDELSKALENIDKEKYLTIIKQKTFLSYVLSHFVYALRPGLFPTKDRKIKSIDNFTKAPIVNFLRNEDITISNIDAGEIFKMYNNQKTTLIFLDPPYIEVENGNYKNPVFNIYEHLYYNPIKNEEAFIVLVLELTWIIKMLFKDEVKYTYEKIYRNTHKKTTHAIISNKNLLQSV